MAHRELISEDGRYLLVEQDGDHNKVVYLRDPATGRLIKALWDSQSYEATHGTLPPDPPSDLPGVTLPDLPADPPRPPPVSDGEIHPQVIRVTNDRDGEFVNRQYAYWSSAVILANTVIVFAGHVDERPRFFRVDIASGQVQRLGPLLKYTGTGEGWYWDTEGWIYLLEGPRLRRVNPFTGEDHVVFDISDSHPGCRLWQVHSSDDGQTHSATVQRIVSEGPYPRIGTVVCRHGRQDFYQAQGALDESAITPDGEFLIIKEDEDNRIINLVTRETRILSDADGAVGHSDCGPGIVVGEDNIHGVCVLWDLRKPLTPGHRRELFKTWGMGHVSVRGGRCLLSDATHLSLVALDGSGVTPILAHGMVGSGYDFQVHGNLDPSGRVACYMTNAHGRLDMFLKVL